MLARHGLREIERLEWDRQYRDGRWRHLSGTAEAARYERLAGRILAAGARHVLDLGCGEALLLHCLNSRGFTGRYLGVDWSYTALAACPRMPGHAFLCANAAAIPFAAAAFDVVVLSEVLYYLSDPWPALRRALELVTPHGQLLVSLYRPPPARRRAWAACIAELEGQLAREPGAEPVHEIAGVNGARRWALYVFSRPGHRHASGTAVR